MEAIAAPLGWSIAREKIDGYLLNADHPEGGPKALYFIARGFDPAAPDAFAEALFRHARPERLVRTRRSLWGVKFIFEGPLPTPDGRDPRVRAVWLCPPGGGEVAQLVTAYTF